MKILVSSLSEPKVRSAVLGKVRQEKIGDIAFPLQKIMKSPSISDNILQGKAKVQNGLKLFPGWLNTKPIWCATGFATLFLLLLFLTLC